MYRRLRVLIDESKLKRLKPIYVPQWHSQGASEHQGTLCISGVTKKRSWKERGGAIALLLFGGHLPTELLSGRSLASQGHRRNKVGEKLWRKCIAPCYFLFFLSWPQCVTDTVLILSGSTSCAVNFGPLDQLQTQWITVTRFGNRCRMCLLGPFVIHGIFFFHSICFFSAFHIGFGVVEQGGRSAEL